MYKRFNGLLCLERQPYLRPIIRNSIREYLPIVIETATCDGLFHRFGRFQLSTRVFVPKTKSTIASYSRYSSVYWMECYVIYLSANG